MNPDPLAADALWQRAPCAALRLWFDDAGVMHWRLNAAAVEWSLGAGVSDDHWQALAAGLPGALAGPLDGEVRAGAYVLDYRALALPPGWLLWLTPQPQAAAGRDGGWRDAAEKLALMQGFERMGFFERDTRDGRDWWDAHMFRLVGMQPALRPPSFEQAVQRIHPDDRERLLEHHRRSMQRAGRYEVRYRLQLPDGRQRDVQSLTEVRNGGDGQPVTMLGVLIDDTEGADKVRAQQAVSAQLAKAIELALISVWRVDLRTQRLYMNDIGFGFNGLAPQPEGIALAEMRARVHPDDVAASLRAADQAIAEEGIVDVETRYLHNDGSYRHLLTRRVAVRDDRGQAVAIAGVSLDQTEHIAERERAQALARRIQLVADAAGVGVWTIDSAHEGGAERVEWNAQMFRIYGLPEDGPAPPVQEWMGQRVHVQDRKRVADERKRARKAGQNGFETEFRIVRPDGSLRWVVCRSRREERDGRSLMYGIHLDMTHQRAQDLELRLQAHRMKLATQIAGVGIWDRDLDTEQVIWEEQMYRLRGLHSDDPRTPREIDEQIMSAPAIAQRRLRIQRHLRDAEPYEYEFEVRWPDGSVHWLASTGHAVRDENGKPERMVGLNWDVTQRKRAESALRDAETAERASRAKSEFLARMSHELRTPLNAMLGFAQLLQHDRAERLDAVQTDRLARIQSAGTHLLSLIDDVLDLAAVEAGSLPVSLRPVDVDGTIDEVRQWVAPLAAERELCLQVHTSGAWVRADRRRLRQIVANLLTNAVKYNHRGGRIWVGAGAEAVDGVPGWRLSVRDNGRGLSVAQQAHLFEPFNRLGAEREGIEGRGLGLMTVHHLVQLMGGQLQVQSESGQGSDFRVWLPAAPALDEDAVDGVGALAAAGAGAVESQTSGEPEQGVGPAAIGVAAPRAAPPLSVLYIEDNAVNVMVIEELLALRSNVLLRVAADGASGVAAALRDRPDLVLVDMQLPDIDGYEVLRRLREHGLRARVIALSANAMPDEPARARAFGFDHYWTKPIDFKLFLNGLDDLAERCAPRDASILELSGIKE